MVAVALIWQALGQRAVEPGEAVRSGYLGVRERPDRLHDQGVAAPLLGQHVIDRQPTRPVDDPGVVGVAVEILGRIRAEDEDALDGLVQEGRPDEDLVRREVRDDVRDRPLADDARLTQPLARDPREERVEVAASLVERRQQRGLRHQYLRTARSVIAVPTTNRELSGSLSRVPSRRWTNTLDGPGPCGRGVT